jgi:hypothetical protein
VIRLSAASMAVSRCATGMMAHDILLLYSGGVICTPSVVVAPPSRPRQQHMAGGLACVQACGLLSGEASAGCQLGEPACVFVSTA